MKPTLEFDNGELYSQLMEEINSIANVAFLTKGKIDPHIHDRLERSVKKAEGILRDGVSVSEYPTHINLDADPPEEAK